jgi:hypothetical protein
MGVGALRFDCPEWPRAGADLGDEVVYGGIADRDAVEADLLFLAREDRVRTMAGALWEASDRETFMGHSLDTVVNDQVLDHSVAASGR